MLYKRESTIWISSNDYVLWSNKIRVQYFGADVVKSLLADDLLDFLHVDLTIDFSHFSVLSADTKNGVCIYMYTDSKFA